jgi:hypothetical protein
MLTWLEHKESLDQMVCGPARQPLKLLPSYHAYSGSMPKG